MIISARDMDYKSLNDIIRNAEADIQIEDCCGQRFIGTNLANKKIEINGTPGNALGAYLNGSTIEVFGNVQDAVGDTMNEGRLIVHGNAGDALGYAMRGGAIFIEGDAGYRTGIHMKEYEDKKPVIIVGGNAGSFLGEYLAGGLIVVLGLYENSIPVGNFAGTGMHGGKIFIRTNEKLKGLPSQVSVDNANSADLKMIEPYLKEFADCFNLKVNEILSEGFLMLSPDAKNPYHQLYVAN